MSLRQQAESDLSFILEDKDGGFGWDIEITSPAGQTASFVGFSGDISRLIDPQTGMAVTGQIAHVALRNSSLIAVFGALPKGVSRESENAWVVKFNDLADAECKFKIVESAPDKTLGMSTYALEFTK